MKKILLALTLAFSVSSANAQFVTGATLIELINSYNLYQRSNGSDASTYAVNVARLFGYVSAVADESQGYSVCLPQGVTLSQLIAVIEKYLREHPEQWNQNGALLSQVALYSAFACPKK